MRESDSGSARRSYNSSNTGTRAHRIGCDFMGLVTKKTGSPHKVRIYDTYDAICVGLQDPAPLVQKGQLPRHARIHGPLEVADDFPEAGLLCLGQSALLCRRSVGLTEGSNPLDHTIATVLPLNICEPTSDSHSKG
jgi:hypothetical protein